MIDSQKYNILLPARIVEFFPEDQTATVQICAEAIFQASESTTNLKVRKPLEGVPVHTVGGGGWHITMPIKTGDSCLISFSQVGYDHWLYEDKDEAGLLAGVPVPHLRRKFHENDGFVVVGFNTIPRAVRLFSPTDSEWRNDNVDPEGEDVQAIRLKEDLSIVIDSSVSVTINAPSVVVNCETSEVNASTSATITTPTSTVDCDNATIKSSANTTIDSPVTDVTGILNVTGAINGSGGLAISGGSGAVVTGDVTADGVSLKGHTHAITSGSSAGETAAPS